MIDKIRSIFFNVLYIIGSFALSVVLFWTLLLPRKYCVRFISFFYGGYIALIQRYVMGIKTEVRGLEHLPKDNRFIIAAKHQSALETLKIPFTRAWHYPVIVLKKELTYLPFWGLYTIRTGQIPIDRKSGAKALSEMVRGINRAFDEGRSFAIFPEGTRKPVGATPDYKAGLAKLYKDLNVPIVPLALNTGLVWGRNAFFKKSGTVVFEFLPPIPAGEPPLKMMEKLETALETASNKLCDIE